MWPVRSYSSSRMAHSLWLIALAESLSIFGYVSQQTCLIPPSNGNTRRSPLDNSLLFVKTGNCKFIVDPVLTSGRVFGTGFWNVYSSMCGIMLTISAVSRPANITAQKGAMCIVEFLRCHLFMAHSRIHTSFVPFALFFNFDVASARGALVADFAAWA